MIFFLVLKFFINFVVIEVNTFVEFSQVIEENGVRDKKMKYKVYFFDTITKGCS